MRKDDLVKRLVSEGAPHRAASEIAGLWASTRHLWRVERTIQAAPGSTDPEKAFWILADALGVGGTNDIEGVGTARHPAFRGLGKGRWNASDGEAWRAAACQAYNTISGGRLKIEPSNHLGFVVVSSARGETTFPLPHHWEGEEFRWARAMVLRAAAIAAARDLDMSLPRHCLGPEIPSGWVVEGSLDLWASCLEQLAHSDP